MVRYGEESCAVRLEEGPDDDCRYAVDCSANLCKSFFYRFVNTADRTGHPGHCHTDHTHRLLYIGRRGTGHGRLISCDCRGGTSRRRGGSRPHGASDPGIVVARLPDVGMTDVHPAGSTYCAARSGEPEPSLCG